MQKWYSNKLHLALVLLALVAVWYAYLPTLSSKKEFTNWDDPGYVINQPLVKTCSADSIKAMFSPSRVVLGNYHPLTVLSLAVNYHFSELNPRGYFFTNVLLHLLNTFLVFLFIYHLSRRNFFMGIACALLFGLHPMHVESVSWLAERKDVLYTFFFLLSLIFYLVYTGSGKKISLVLSVLFFIFSCLSKAMAVVLPVLLLLIDYLQGRKISVKSILPKIPFFLIALLCGILALQAQASAQAMNESNSFSAFQKLLFSSHSIIQYLVKFFAPVDLSGFYPYPDVTQELPPPYYFAPVLVVLLLLVPPLLLRRKSAEATRIYIFGILFFIVSLLPVLQIIAVGGAIMADRYTYVSYIGLFYVVAALAESKFRDKEWRITAVAGVIILSGALGYVSHEREKVWNNSHTFWTDVIARSNQLIEVAHLDRGQYYAAIGNHEKARFDFEVLAKNGSTDDGVYVDLGNEYVFIKEYDKAIEAYSKAIALNPKNRLALMNRGSAYLVSKNYQLAIGDFDEILKVNDKYTERAQQYRGQALDALKENK